MKHGCAEAVVTLALGEVGEQSLEVQGEHEGVEAVVTVAGGGLGEHLPERQGGDMTRALLDSAYEDLGRCACRLAEDEGVRIAEEVLGGQSPRESGE